MFGEKLAAFYRNLASMLEVGVPASRACGTLANAFPGRYGRRQSGAAGAGGPQ
jgi:type II secretory pathway component PulF